MSSNARIRANQLNAQKSTGPRTSTGKQRSRANALKHGLCAEHVLLPHENAAMLEQIRQDLIEQYQPATNWELRLVEDAAMAYFRVVRSRRFERGLLDLRLRLENEKAQAILAGAQPDQDEGIALALYADDPERLKNFFRYDAAAERAYHRALRELDLARKHRLQAQATKSEKPIGFVPQAAVTAPAISQNSGAGSPIACVPPPPDPQANAHSPAKEPEIPPRAA